MVKAFLVTGSPMRVSKHGPTVGESRPDRHADYDRALTTCNVEESYHGEEVP
jgi:hypothetical protein